MTTLENLARAALHAAAAELPEEVIRDVEDDLAAGEHEIAMITLVEVAPSLVSAADVAQLEQLATDFDPVDARVAERVVSKWRRDTVVPA